jgi:imidazole glycerol-phosphate synthase subunit HisH
VRVIVVDTGLGNLRSVERAVAAAAKLAEKPDVTVERSHDADALRHADKLVFPGQGGFRDCVHALAGGLGDALVERLRAGVPYLGICLGLQVLFESSAEAPDAKGLGWFQGRVLRLSPEGGVKIPHVGWNQLELAPPGHRFFGASGEGAWFYFVHSFFAVPSDASVVAASATHGENRITAAVARDNVFASQFHPEKSQANGLSLIAEFLR